MVVFANVDPDFIRMPEKERNRLAVYERCAGTRIGAAFGLTQVQLGVSRSRRVEKHADDEDDNQADFKAELLSSDRAVLILATEKRDSVTVYVREPGATDAKPVDLFTHLERHIPKDNRDPFCASLTTGHDDAKPIPVCVFLDAVMWSSATNQSIARLSDISMVEMRSDIDGTSNLTDGDVTTLMVEAGPSPGEKFTTELLGCRTGMTALCFRT
jgi:hypothetical protein